MAIQQKTLPATIAAGQALSNAILVGDFTLCGLYIPAGWTGTGAITWQTSFDGGNTFVELNDSTGAAVSLPATTAAGTYYALDLRNPNLAGLTLVKLRSGTVGAPVNQASQMILQVITRRFNPAAP